MIKQICSCFCIKIYKLFNWCLIGIYSRKPFLPKLIERSLARFRHQNKKPSGIKISKFRLQLQQVSFTSLLDTIPLICVIVGSLSASRNDIVTLVSSPSTQNVQVIPLPLSPCLYLQSLFISKGRPLMSQWTFCVSFRRVFGGFAS